MYHFLAERYKIVEVIGKGGMGKVFHAYDLEKKQDVALKKLTLHTENAIKRFQREYKILKEIRHPNIVRVQGFFQLKKDFFLVMEYVSGISLQKFIEDDSYPVIPRQTQIRIFIELANAVKELHKHNIAHRDIKPANIIFNPKTYDVTLVDFGLAKSRKINVEITSVGCIVGTPSYLSPEQLNGNWSPQSDVFSFAITLYQFLLWHRQSPFTGASKINTMININNKNLPPLVELLDPPPAPQARKLFQALSKCIKSATHKTASKRCSIEELRQNLIDVHEGLNTQKLYRQSCQDVTLHRRQIIKNSLCLFFVGLGYLSFVFVPCALFFISYSVLSNCLKDGKLFNDDFYLVAGRKTVFSSIFLLFFLYIIFMAKGKLYFFAASLSVILWKIIFHVKRFIKSAQIQKSVKNA